MDDELTKSMWSVLCICFAWVYVVLCIEGPLFFIHPGVFVAVLALYSLAVGVLWRLQRVRWWALIPAVIGVGFVVCVLQIILSGPPY